ncbi:hypothetical protein [Cellulomonas sp. ATA003]|uniref:hypothetical protein n=1 Tax=Cellulomonas sp. ATA003 TaxID=3073064 RepID=UPI002872BC50|nr:hypothetical protein [Cellulomonas sp. ATA003]WNB87326.1 hypothetical protein REH70_09615 [Cellulomonas sp. ATA003]
MIGDFHAVLDAIASHTRRLLWPAQIRRVGLTSHRDGLPPNERAAIALAAGIEALVGEARPHPSQLTPATTPWLRAALHLRAASDLIATHFHSDGRPRTPDAAATDTRALDAGLVDLGHLAAAILSAEESLALRALQIGVSKTVITTHLPGLGHLADLTRNLSTADRGADPDPRARLQALPQTWTPIRTDEPVLELGDRMHRLRQATFDMTAEHGDTLATLRDITTIGIAVHAHAAAFHGARPTTAADPAPGAHGAEALVLRGRAWQGLHRELSHFVTLAPPHATVRDDLVALSRLLPALAPLEADMSTATHADSAARRIGASLNGAIATMTDIGDHSAGAFADLARSGALRINARDLPRDLVTDDPALALDRLRGAFVRAPDAVVDTIQTQYRAVRQHPVEAIAVTTPLGPLPNPRRT